MNRPRVAILSRHFWPYRCENTGWLTDLAVELLCYECDSIVVTARWDVDGPSKVMFRNVPVHRIAPPPTGSWTTIGYLRQVDTWLHQHLDEFNVVYVSTLREDAYAVLGAVRRTKIPVVLRVENEGLHGDCHWQQTSPWGKRIRRRCLSANAFVVSTPGQIEELTANGYPSDRLFLIPPGVKLRPTKTARQRLLSRSAMKHASSELATSTQFPLILSIGQTRVNGGVKNLISAWTTLIQYHTKAQLWLIGHGENRHQIPAEIEQSDVSGSARVPGKFDALEDLLDAADLLVLPEPNGSSVSLIAQSMSAGLPMIATDCLLHRSVLEHNRTGLLLQECSPYTLANAIAQLLDQPMLATRLGSTARDECQRRFSLDMAAQLHKEMFTSLLS